MLRWTGLCPTGPKSLAEQLNPEEQVPDLVADYRISAGFPAGEALIRGEHEVRGILKMEKGLDAIQILGWLGSIDAIFDDHPPLAAPFAIHNQAELRAHASRRLLIY